MARYFLNEINKKCLTWNGTIFLRVSYGTRLKLDTATLDKIFLHNRCFIAFYALSFFFSKRIKRD